MKYLPLIAVTGLLASCSSFSSLTDVTNLVDYSNHKSVKILEVPADLDKPTFDNTYVTNVSDEIAAGKSVAFGSVPLVDSSMTAPAASSLVIGKQGSQLALKATEAGGSLWQKTIEGLKAMGMTTGKSNQAAGVIQVRDRSQVSSPDSTIGAFLNRTMGKLNQGTEYQVLVKADTVIFADAKGGVLPEEDSQSLLTRLKKELTSAE